MNAKRITSAAVGCLLVACAVKEPSAVAAGAPGFFTGLWHGLIAPIALIGGIFSSSVSMYAVPNSGGATT